MRLVGRRVVITVAACGIGRAAAELLPAKDAALALLDRTDDDLQQVAQGTRGTALLADLTDEAQLLDAVAKDAEAMGGIDGIVDCAGIAGSHTLDTLDRACCERLVAIN